MEFELNPDFFRAVVEDSPNGIYITDRSRQIAFWNTSAQRITGYLAQEVIGHFCQNDLLMHCDDTGKSLCGCACPLLETIQDGRPREANIYLRHKQGHRVPVLVRSIPLRDEFGAVIGSAEVFEESACRFEENRTPDSAKRVSLDRATDIPDREVVLAGVSAALEAFAASAAAFGVLSVAVDHLDHLRHVYGCQAIREIYYATAQTLLAGTRPEDLVGRLKEDRFTVLVVCPSLQGLHACAERLRRVVSLAAVPWWGDRLAVTVSMGGAMGSEGDTADSLLARAEQNLEAAIAAGADSVIVS